jgi:protein-L-isoaspartate(D-aspartate) O-methyltransferase
MGDPTLQRKNMVESQIRPSDVTDRRILRAMSDIPRERFVPAQVRDLAYMDQDVPVIAPARHRGARYLLAPRVLAKMVQALELGARDRVLDVGCATGYSSALLAKLARTVVALEHAPALAEQARIALAQQGVENVQVVVTTLASGYPGAGPYDAILLNGSVPDAPKPLLDQLKEHGRLVAVLAANTFGKATVWRRVGGLYDPRPVFDAGAPRLPGFDREAEFVF